MFKNPCTQHRFRRLFPIFIILFLFRFSGQSQVGICYEVRSFSDNQVTLDAVVYNFDDIVSIQYSTRWNSAFLQLESVYNFNLANLSIVSFGWENGGEALAVSWLDGDTNGESLPDGSTLYSVTFARVAEVIDEIYISDDPTPIEIIDAEDNLLTLETKPTLVYPANIRGNVFQDNNEDCFPQSEEDNLAHWTVAVTNDVYTVYSRTDETGNFQIGVQPGDYELTLVPPSVYWEACSNATNLNITVNDIEEIQEIDLGGFALQDCPDMNVDISTPFLRRCFENTYTVSYCNLGTVTATDVTIEVELDEFLEVTDTSIPGSNTTDNVYVFEVGDVKVGECAEFTIDVMVNCDDTVLGQTHCVEANITAANDCNIVDPLWSGADLEVTGECIDDEVIFTIKNNGEDMVEPSNYIVVEDAIMYMAEPFTLNSGEELVINKTANGATFRMNVEQVAFHPELSTPNSIIEGCGTNETGTFSTGFVNMFSMDDAASSVAIDCQENIGAYDPNDKTGYPTGYSDEKYIKANTDLEYKIRFQNTGTDTAFNIVIVDTLSKWLDPATIQSGASSHPYRMDLLGEDILQFTFSNIMLPDSNINEAASHGFVHFRIAQQKDNPLETVIENSAAIYFDFNEPIITNTTFHTIGEDFVEVMSATHEVFLPQVEVLFYPNPFVETATIDVKGMKTNQLLLRLYTSTGQLVREELMRAAPYTFQREGLQSGLYFFELMADGVLVSNGKMKVR